MNCVTTKHRGTVVVKLPIRTVSESNGRDHWAAKARRVRAQRGATALSVAAACVGVELPVVVTLTRIAPRRLDDDNLRGALKACRDGVADAFGVDDRDPGITWQYDQRRGKPADYAIEIAVCRAQDAPGRVFEPPSGTLLAGE